MEGMEDWRTQDRRQEDKISWVLQNILNSIFLQRKNPQFIYFLFLIVIPLTNTFKYKQLTRYSSFYIVKFNKNLFSCNPTLCNKRYRQIKTQLFCIQEKNIGHLEKTVANISRAGKCYVELQGRLYSWLQFVKATLGLF